MLIIKTNKQGFMRKGKFNNRISFQNKINEFNRKTRIVIYI